MMTDGRTIEVDIMTLFNQIDHKLDNMVTMVAMKADIAALTSLLERVTNLEIHGSNNARTASEGVENLKNKISSLGWRVAFALISAMLAVAGTIVVGLMNFGK